MNSTLKVLALIAVTVASSCKSSRENQPATPDIDDWHVEEQVNDQFESKIIGSWEWVKTVCCFRTPKTVTADSLGFNKVLKFRKDGTLEYYEDGNMTGTETYKVSYGLMDDDRPVLKIGTGKTALLYIRQDTMIIDYGYMDLQTEFYRKLKD